MAHTPGPWKVFTDKLNGGAGQEYHHILAGTNDKDVICTFMAASWRAQNRTDEQRANARLVAAAPELLDALKVAVKFLYSIDDLNTAGSDIYAQLEAAVENAEGEGS